MERQPVTAAMGWEEGTPVKGLDLRTNQQPLALTLTPSCPRLWTAVASQSGGPNPRRHDQSREESRKLASLAESIHTESSHPRVTTLCCMNGTCVLHTVTWNRRRLTIPAEWLHDRRRKLCNLQDLNGTVVKSRQQTETVTSSFTLTTPLMVNCVSEYCGRTGRRLPLPKSVLDIVPSVVLPSVHLWYSSYRKRSYSPFNGVAFIICWV